MGKKGRQENPKRLGAKLISIRSDLALSQNEMLRYLGINEEYTREEISAYERGVRTPPLHILLKYSKAIRVWINVLIDDELDLPTGLPAQRMHGGVPRFTPGKQRTVSHPTAKPPNQVSSVKNQVNTKGSKRKRSRRP
jgi:transcriptional regulator with XRE-family HTH domain